MNTPTQWLALGIPDLRELAGLTQGGLARAMRVHRVSVARWEGGEHRPGDAELRALLDTFSEILLDRDVATFRRFVLAIPSRRVVIGSGGRGPGDFTTTIDDADFERAARIRIFLLVNLVLGPSKVELPQAEFERTLGLPAGSLRAVPEHPRPGGEPDAPRTVMAAGDIGVELQVRIGATTRAEYLAVCAKYLKWDAATVVERIGIPRIQAEALHQLRIAITDCDVVSIAAASIGKEEGSRGGSPLHGADSNGGERSGTTDV